MNGYVPELVRSDSMFAMWHLPSVHAPRNSVRSPAFTVRLEVAFQSSCRKTAELLCRYEWLYTPAPPKANGGVPWMKFPKSETGPELVKNSCPLNTCGNDLSSRTRVYCP